MSLPCSRNYLTRRTFKTIAMADAMEKMVVILNQERQIVYAYKTFLNVAGVHDINPILVKRPGDAIYCIHASQTSGDCGTTEYCKTCGAVNAILEAQKGRTATKECRISTTSNDAGRGIGTY